MTTKTCRSGLGGSGACWAAAERQTDAAKAAASGSNRGPRRERGERPEGDGGPEPEFAPAFLTRDDD